MSENYIKLNPIDIYRSMVMLVAAPEVIPLVVGTYTKDDRNQKLIELQTRIKMLQLAFMKSDEGEDGIDTSEYPQDIMLELMLEDVTALCDVFIPQLSEEDRKEFAEAEKEFALELAADFAGFVKDRVESDPSVIEDLTDQEIEVEVDGLKESFLEDIKSSLIFGLEGD